MSRSVEEIDRLIERESRKLQKLEEQKAEFGLFVPPYIQIHIEDTEEKIRKLEMERVAAASPQLPLGKRDAEIQKNVRRKALEQIKRATVYLNLSNYDLRELPEEMWRLTQLKKLDIRGAGLSELPPQIGSLVNLTELDVYNNRLLSLPPEIGNLKKLEFLDLEGNPIERLPPELGYLRNLRELKLNLTQLDQILAERYQSGIEQFLEYLRRQTWSEDVGKMWWLWHKGLQRIDKDKLLESLREKLQESHQAIILSQIKPMEVVPDVGQQLEFQSLFFEGKRLMDLPLQVGKKGDIVLLLERKKRG